MAFERPFVRGGVVEGFPQPAPALADAEKAFIAERWADAQAAYKLALEQCPTCYTAMAGWADCELRRSGGDLPGALGWYERALELNPYDAQLHVFRASALFRMGRVPEAQRELVEALVLRPRYGFALKLALAARQARSLPMEIDAVPLLPTGYLKSAGGDKLTFVKTSGGNAIDDLPWIFYAACKRIGPNKEYAANPTPRHPWDRSVETGCLKSLAARYKEQNAALSEAEKARNLRVERQGSAGLDRLVRAVDAGYLDEFVTYEIQARMEPSVTLILPIATRQRIQGYVERFVLGLRPVGPR